LIANTNSRTTKQLNYSEIWNTTAYNADKTFGLGVGIAFSAKASIDILNNKIVNATRVKWKLESVLPYIGSPYMLTTPHYIVNNGYSSKIVVTFGIEVYAISAYYKTELYSKTYFYHVIAQ
jgi:hypothetical protein